MLAATIVLVAAGAIAMWRAHPEPARRAAVRVEPRSADELAATLALADDVWSEHDGAGEPVTVVLAPARLAELRARGVPARVIVDDIDAEAERERARLAVRATVADWFAEYRDVDELDAHLTMLAEQHPALARLRTLG